MMILSAIAAKLKRRSKGDFRGRHFEGRVAKIFSVENYPHNTGAIRSDGATPRLSADAADLELAIGEGGAALVETGLQVVLHRVDARRRHVLVGRQIR